MINYNTLGNRLKSSLLKFSEKVSKGFSKPARKLIADVLYGMTASHSCKITDIGRALLEPIALKKTVERICRGLSNFDRCEALMQNYLSVVKPSLGSDTMLLIDGGDATKSCSPKMEAIGSVKDGSTGKFADGYWTIGAVALSDEMQQPLPVYENLYPCTKQGGLGSNAETAKCVQSLRENFDGNIPRVFDRGFDSGDLIQNLTGHGEKFILRAAQNRVAVHNGTMSHIEDIVRGVVCEVELPFQSKSGRVSKCKIGMTQVVLPRVKNVKLNLVVCKEFGEKPLVLYTNLDEALENIALRVVKGYLMRWRIEEFYAFKKERGMQFEDFRVRGLNSIRNLDLLVTIAIGFIGIMCENIDSKATFELIAISKRIPKIAAFMKKTKFFFYAVLSGITSVLATLRCGIASYFAPTPTDNQLCFAGFQKMG